MVSTCDWSIRRNTALWLVFRGHVTFVPAARQCCRTISARSLNHLPYKCTNYSLKGKRNAILYILYRDNEHYHLLGAGESIVIVTHSLASVCFLCNYTV